MKKITILSLVTLLSLLLSAATPVFAQSGDVSKIQNFIQNVIQVMVTLAGLLAAGFFVWGGVGYITSSGNPEHLDRSKKTILYSAVGLAVVLGAFVLSNIVAQIAGSAFGSTTSLNH
ncbi:MAG TPA: pilin [Candidatus Nitrosocosmicus sp.]|nr:pilin [Candidatus Nitrosocosmicus sp.]